MTPPSDQRLIAVAVDETAFPPPDAGARRDRETAISDIVASNRHFSVDGGGGPFQVDVGISEDRLIFAISGRDGVCRRVAIPRAALSSLIKDYNLLCDSYDEAIAQGRRARIETIDVGRRSLHNDGATTLLEHFGDEVETDWETARRLFTLTCLLMTRRHGAV